MKYSDLVSEYITKSGLSLSEIAKRMNQQGIKIDRSYLSKLKNNPKYPASDEVNRVLAEVTGGDPEKLVFSGYVEKAPKEAKKTLRHFFENIDSYAMMVALFFSNPEQNEDELKNEVDSIYKNIQNMPVDKKFDFVLHYYNRMVAARQDIFQELGQSMGVPQKRIDNTIEAHTKLPLIRVNVFDLLNDVEYYEWTPAEKLKYGEYIYIIADDDSMSGSNIKKGSRILCKLINDSGDANMETERIESGKLYSVILNDKIMIRRLFMVEKQPITLLADNPKYPPIFVNDDSDFTIIARVISVEFDPNQD